MAGRAEAIAWAERFFDEGRYIETLARRVAIPTESQNPARGPEMRHYLEDELGALLDRLGFSWRIVENPVSPSAPLLFAERIEDGSLPTVLGYGHADVVLGMEEKWQAGLSPWKLTEREGLLYGRGTADNKGQHTINLAAMEAVLATRGRLGFNAKWLIETGEETGSPGFGELCTANRDAFAADLLVASDGPRPIPERATLSLGARGAMEFDLVVALREGAHHSGNWGGLLASPGTLLAHAIASIAGKRGEILVPAWRPPALDPAVREALKDCDLANSSAYGPLMDPWWGEPGLTPAERVFAWTSFEVLAMETGDPKKPVGAIPPRAWARCGLRFPAEISADAILPALRRHLDEAGLERVAINAPESIACPASRTALDNPWVGRARQSMEQTEEKPIVVLPNMGGWIPNNVFAETLGLATLWVPHSYPACSQHAPNEHLPAFLAREGLRLMTGLYWDLGAEQ